MERFDGKHTTFEKLKFLVKEGLISGTLIGLSALGIAALAGRPDAVNIGTVAFGAGALVGSLWGLLSNPHSDVY